MKIASLFALVFVGYSSFALQGDLLSVTQLNSTEPSEIANGRQSFCPGEKSANKTLGFTRYKITFETVDVSGKTVISAGLLINPDGVDPKPMVVYQHGTLFGRSELPSSNPQFGEGDAIGYCFSSLGYVAVIADYLGFGDGTGVHPYLHADSEAWVARDMMRASKAALGMLSIELNSKLFVAGYSQGGHAAMALLRFLEQDETQEFKVTAAAPMAGPYALSETTSEIFDNPAPHAAAEATYIIEGLNPVYSFYKNLNEIVKPQYVDLVTNLFDGSHDWSDVSAKLNMGIHELIQPAYLDQVKNDPNNGFMKAIHANGVYKWTPKTPVHLYHGHGDNEVPYANSELAYQYMKGHGAQIELINLGQQVNHSAGFVLAIAQAAQWFDTF